MNDSQQKAAYDSLVEPFDNYVMFFTKVAEKGKAEGGKIALGAYWINYMFSASDEKNLFA